ncbi:MAG: peroxidase [Lewinellaceae bacterium]|nr:hypothetical protein [Saprospiraceae bacterium]MCB9339245.1 peroxidase [Lewinellaceae bacterium]
MANKSHHGNQSKDPMNAMCRHQSFEAERIGRFGRMFRKLPPLYTGPGELAKLGAPNGPMDGGTNPLTTNTFPLGMVFFGQFIDHDITFDPSSSLDKINHPEEIENFRTPNLDLDCIFGEGPDDEPFLYVKKDQDHRLLTGETNKNYGQPEWLAANDLARTASGTAIIGDSRNDENRILSQFQLAMIRFYNFLYEKTADARPGASAKELYEVARKEASWNYQWIIVNEFLPLIAGEEVVDKILSEGRKFYTPCSRPYLPVEFSVAAYRFGHSMVPHKLKLQPNGPKLNLFSRELGFGFSPITDESQIVDWEAFFNFGSGLEQKANNLDTKMASTLLSLPFFPSSNPAEKSLATRNMLRANSFLMPSGESLAERMGRPADEIKRVHDFVKQQTHPYQINLKRGTPLWFYLLAEAEVLGRKDYDGHKPGEGLGPVGATIVAEVLLGLLELDSSSFFGNNRNWQPNLTADGTMSMKTLLESAMLVAA